MIPHTLSHMDVLPAVDSIDALRIGMHVRIPLEPERSDGQFRDFYLGRIQGFDELAGTVDVLLHHRELDDIKEERVTIPRSWVSRCRILPDSKIALIDRDAGGVALAACDMEWSPGEFCDYYVRIDGKTVRMSESNFITASHRGDPDPRLQLATYEFQNPTFRPLRDALVESYSELRAATFGIEELVGSRIMLLAHQAEVVATVLSDAECRYILADEVGLGKTIEAAVILRGLRRRHPRLRTLILAPASLINQWYFELDHKFWLRFSLLNARQRLGNNHEGPGLILSHEQIANDAELFQWIASQTWDLLIVDEAHHVPKRIELDERVHALSRATPRVLLLSATPIQRRATEFLSLLKLLDPFRYDKISAGQFADMVAAQHELLRIIARLAPDLTPEYFDPDDFCNEMETVLDLLRHDTYLAKCVAQVRADRNQARKSLTGAQAAVAYISENYRLERRVIRNRRVNLQIDLPTRIVNESYTYTPNTIEASALDELHDYADYLLEQHNHTPIVQEIVRLLFHAGFSSPHALLGLLQQRRTVIKTSPASNTTVELQRLVTPGAPRKEPERIKQLLDALHAGEDELTVLERALWQAERWQDETVQELEKLPYRRRIPAGTHRFVQVMHAVDEYIQKYPKAKIVIFTQWLASLRALQPYLQKHLGKEAIFEFHIGFQEDDLQDQVFGFQEAEQKSILLCDELGGEGRNFQMADLIIHLDLPWTPAKLEQRIGRVDRLGRSGEVLSIVPYAREQMEHDLYQLWQNAFELFTRSMSGMEIVLEGIQDELMDSLRYGTRDGLARILPEMMKRAQSVREQVEEERYYEERAINTDRREEFARISTRYDDGTILRNPLLDWANQAGLRNSYHRETDIAIYFPRDFSQASMKNAKFREVPNMEDALARSRRASSLRIEGTFNRAIAVTREDLVFYAPSSDPWTDAIIRNAIEADRGRCCSIRRESPAVEKPCMIFELTYRVQIDPRRLLELGHDPIHLLRAQGYLYTPIYRLLLTHTGKRLATSHPLAKVIQSPYHKGTDTHLGQRSGEKPPMTWFKRQLPEETWHGVVEQVFASADNILAEDFAFMEEMAEEAKEDFDQAERGLRAAADWYIEHKLIRDAKAHLATIDTYREISEALVAGLHKPHINLESICCWVLRPAKS